MKKSIISVLVFALLISSVSAKSKKNEQNNNEDDLRAESTNVKYTESSEEDSEDVDWKDQGKKVLEETGKFFNSVGETVKEKVDQASEIKCYGTWKCESQNCTTTLKCNKDGTMEITKKVGTETDYWKGTYSATFKIITFTITASGRKGVFTNKQSDNQPQIWRFIYSVQSEDTLKVTSTDIPTDVDGNDFNKGVIFTRK